MPNHELPTTDLHLAGVVDPARYSDRAVAVFEMAEEDYDADFGADMIAQLEREVGMRCLIIVGARLARIEEPTP